MKVNKNTALQILEDEAFSNQELPVEWCNLVDRLSFECDEGANKTFIAMLGTALLARATNN